MPRLLLHAENFALSVIEAFGGSSAGASPETDCLCSAYSSRRSRFYNLLDAETNKSRLHRNNKMKFNIYWLWWQGGASCGIHKVETREQKNIPTEGPTAATTS